MEYTSITLGDIYLARQRITPFIRRTYMVDSPYLAQVSDAQQVVLKLENLQVTGSFKPRGVANRLLTLSTHERSRGVIAVSTGNHGRAISYLAHKLGIPATICVSKNVPELKRNAIKQYGADLITAGETYDDAVKTMIEMAKDRNLTLIRSFEEPTITAGHGTIGLEILEDIPEVDTVLVPLAAGGLLIGIATAVKAANPNAKIIGVAMERGSLLVQSLIAGKIVPFTEEPTLADALMGGLGPDPEIIFKIIRPFVDEAVTVSEEEIAHALAFILEKHRQVVEGAGAVGIAALLNRKATQLGKYIAVIVTGGNIDLSLLLHVAQGELSSSRK